ncbi:syndecan isoform X1 [Uranotaenia lowii]|uniref:syndecan isoform X1 n=1 Tax=Uranotaenia lowii TaxID=190385 RepID=UPI00247A7CF4|nr:syndecan isoform X1 [Uranotaenia lowii]
MYLKRIYISTTLLALFVLTVPWSTAEAQDDQKSNNRNSQSASASSSSSFGAGGSSPNNDIYIDDEGLEGSGSRGEIRDDLEKEDDESSGSGYGDDDEDSGNSNSNSGGILGGGGGGGGLGILTGGGSNSGRSNVGKNNKPSEGNVGGGSGDHENYDDDDNEDDVDDLYTETKKPPSVDPSTTDDEDMPIDKDNRGKTQSGGGGIISRDGIINRDGHQDEDLDLGQTKHITPTDGHDSQHPYGGSGVLIMNANNEDRTASFFAQPGILAAVIGGAVVGLLCAILVVMFIVYRMRKKDEGSYALDEPKRSPTANTYAKNANNREFYA